jgi:hypothetical protein
MLKMLILKSSGSESANALGGAAAMVIPSRSI